MAWLRNGLGQTAIASLESRLPAADLALLRLESALPTAQAEWASAGRDAFPGSIGFLVEYVASRDATPRWPILHSGFIGQPIGNLPRRALNLTLPPGQRGGVMINSQGELVGLAVPKTGGSDELVLVSLIKHALGRAIGTPRSSSSIPSSTPNAASAAPAAPPAHVPVDATYEHALRTSVQLIVKP